MERIGCPEWPECQRDLILATEEGNARGVIEALEAGADVNKSAKGSFLREIASGRKEKSALIAATENDHLDIVRLLLQRGADVDGTTTDGDTPLIVATEYAHLNIVKELLAKGANYNAVGNAGWTPCVIAAWLGSKDCLVALKDAERQGEPLNVNAVYRGHTALDIAEHGLHGQGGSEDAAKYLRDELGALRAQDVKKRPKSAAKTSNTSPP